MSRKARASNRQPANDARRPATQQQVRTVVEGTVVAVLDDGRVRFALAGGKAMVCRCALGVDLEWLRAAVAVAPVVAEGSMAEGGDGSLWALFPGSEHRDVKPGRVRLRATEEILLECGQSTVRLVKDGKVRVRGRDVRSRGSRRNAILGGVVRLN